MYFDESLAGEKNLICGANKEEYHIMGVNIQRDIPDVVYYDLSKVKDGEVCLCCNKGKLGISRGIEIGNIFQLGTKYTEPMGMTVHMPDGSEINPIMGCYGIGVGRNLASIAEESADDKGLVWNMNVAPWEVIISPLRQDDEVIGQKTEELYKKLAENGIDVIVDDRAVSAGVKFADSELLGIPVRVVISPRSMQEGNVEVSFRATGEKIMLKYDEAVDYLVKYVASQKF